MTYEEAKMQIQAIPEKIWDQLSEPDREAMEMAFSALEKQIPKNSNESSLTQKGLDTISRQAAIDAAIKADMENNSNVLSEKRARVIDRHISAVPSAQPEPQWIQCSERLPEDRVDVLVCYRYWQQYAKRYVYTIVNGWYAHKYSVKENIFSEWEQDCDYKEDEDEYYIQEGWYEFTTQGNSDLMSWYICDAEVVAWMPLPEPYRAERRTDD